MGFNSMKPAVITFQTFDAPMVDIGFKAKLSTKEVPIPLMFASKVVPTRKIAMIRVTRGIDWRIERVS